MSLGSKVWIYWEKKRWTKLFKVLGIVNTDIIVDTRNDLVTFWNTYVKLYYCHTKNTNISYLETTNDLAKNPTDKPINEEIPMPLDYLEPEKPYWQEWLGKNYFTNDFIEKMADIFINYKERIDYNLIFKLRHDRIIIIFKDPFK